MLKPYKCVHGNGPQQNVITTKIVYLNDVDVQFVYTIYVHI